MIQKQSSFEKYNPVSKERQKQLFWFFILPKRMYLDDIVNWVFMIDIFFWLFIFVQSLMVLCHINSKKEKLTYAISITLSIFGPIQSFFSVIMKIYTIKYIKSNTISMLMKIWIFFRTIGSSFLL